jgi:hypothetical protein
MPFWPVPPIIALVGTVVALTQQKILDLEIVAGIIIFGLIYYFVYLAPRKDTNWNMGTDAGADSRRP